MAIDPPYRFDPFQNLVNVSWMIPYIAIYFWIHEIDFDGLSPTSCSEGDAVVDDSVLGVRITSIAVAYSNWTLYVNKKVANKPDNVWDYVLSSDESLTVDDGSLRSEFPADLTNFPTQIGIKYFSIPDWTLAGGGYGWIGGPSIVWRPAEIATSGGVSDSTGQVLGPINLLTGLGSPQNKPFSNNLTATYDICAYKFTDAPSCYKPSSGLLPSALAAHENWHAAGMQNATAGAQKNYQEANSVTAFSHTIDFSALSATYKGKTWSPIGLQISDDAPYAHGSAPSTGGYWVGILFSADG